MNVITFFLFFFITFVSQSEFSFVFNPSKPLDSHAPDHYGSAVDISVLYVTQSL